MLKRDEPEKQNTRNARLTVSSFYSTNQKHAPPEQGPELNLDPGPRSGNGEFLHRVLVPW